MHDVPESPGFALDRLHIDAAASLSDSDTVPAAKEFPLLAVVPENAENVPAPATTPTRPTTITVRRALRVRERSPAISGPLRLDVERQRDVLDPVLEPVGNGARQPGP